MSDKLDKRGWRADGRLPLAYRRKHGFPPRQSVRWNGTEDGDLIWAFCQGVPLGKIADKHRRRESAIRQRLMQYGYNP